MEVARFPMIFEAFYDCRFKGIQFRVSATFHEESFLDELISSTVTARAYNGGKIYITSEYVRSLPVPVIGSMYDKP